MMPDMTETTNLSAGQVGYCVLGMKEVHEAKVGDTFFDAGASQPKLYPGFSPVKPVVFSGLYPVDSADFPRLSEALGRLMLSDSSVSISRESSTALGQGFRVGYLGRLHMDVCFDSFIILNIGIQTEAVRRVWIRYFTQPFTLLAVINTAPVVPYRVRIGESEEVIKNPSSFPDDTSMVDCFLEPMANVTLIFPSEYVGTLIELCNLHRGKVYLASNIISVPRADILGRKQNYS
jgi:translation elongation factor EF-4